MMFKILRALSLVALVSSCALPVTQATGVSNAYSTWIGNLVVNAVGHDHHLSVIADPPGGFRAFWCGTEGNSEAGSETDVIFTATSDASYSFGTPTVALQTSGVRIARVTKPPTPGNYGDHRNIKAQDETWVPDLHYYHDTIGYLHRRYNAAAVASATLPVYECTRINTYGITDHFMSIDPALECGRPQNAYFLGYAKPLSQGGGTDKMLTRCRSILGDDYATWIGGCPGGWDQRYDMGWALAGTTRVVNGKTVHESPFADGAFLCPNSVIYTGGTYRMT